MKIVPLHNSPRRRKREDEKYSPWVSALGETGGGSDQSPLNPINISGLRVLVQPSGLSGVDNDPITTWEDSSPNNNDFAQAVAGEKPILKTGIINGLSIARFDGVDDSLQTPYSPKDANDNAFTFAAVFRTTTTATRQLMLWFGDTNSPGFAASGFRTTSFSITNDGIADLVGGHAFDDSNTIVSYSPLTDTVAFHIGICTWSGYANNPGNKTIRMFLDGLFGTPEVESYTVDYAFYSAFINMGRPGAAANFFSGDIAEVAIINRALSSNEITRLYKFWKSKYNL